jgi:hypothetical protein
MTPCYIQPPESRIEYCCTEPAVGAEGKKERKGEGKK